MSDFKKEKKTHTKLVPTMQSIALKKADGNTAAVKYM